MTAIESMHAANTRVRTCAPKTLCCLCHIVTGKEQERKAWTLNTVICTGHQRPSARDLGSWDQTHPPQTWVDALFHQQVHFVGTTT